MREKRVSERSIKQISRKKILPRNNCQNDSSELTNLSSSKVQRFYRVQHKQKIRTLRVLYRFRSSIGIAKIKGGKFLTRLRA